MGTEAVKLKTNYDVYHLRKKYVELDKKLNDLSIRDKKDNTPDRRAAIVETFAELRATEQTLREALHEIKAAISKKKEEVSTNDGLPLAEKEANLRALENTRSDLKKALADIDNAKKKNRKRNAFFSAIGTVQSTYGMARGLWGIVEDGTALFESIQKNIIGPAGKAILEFSKLLPPIQAAIGAIFNTLNMIENLVTPKKWNTANKLRRFNQAVSTIASYAGLALVFNPVTFPLGLTIYLVASVVDTAINYKLLSVALEKQRTAYEEHRRAGEVLDNYIQTTFTKESPVFKKFISTMEELAKKDPSAYPNPVKYEINSLEFRGFLMKEAKDNPLADPKFSQHYKNYMSAFAKSQKADNHVEQKTSALINSGISTLALGMLLTGGLIAVAFPPLGLGLLAAGFVTISAMTLYNIGKKIHNRFFKKPEQPGAKEDLEKFQKLENEAVDKEKLAQKLKNEATEREKLDKELVTRYQESKAALVGGKQPDFRTESSQLKAFKVLGIDVAEQVHPVDEKTVAPVSPSAPPVAAEVATAPQPEVESKNQIAASPQLKH